MTPLALLIAGIDSELRAAWAIATPINYFNWHICNCYPNLIFETDAITSKNVAGPDNIDPEHLIYAFKLHFF